MNATSLRLEDDMTPDFPVAERDATTINARAGPYQPETIPDKALCLRDDSR